MAGTLKSADDREFAAPLKVVHLDVMLDSSSATGAYSIAPRAISPIASAILLVMRRPRLATPLSSTTATASWDRAQNAAAGAQVEVTAGTNLNAVKVRAGNPAVATSPDKRFRGSAGACFGSSDLALQRPHGFGCSGVGWRCLDFAGGSS